MKLRRMAVGKMCTVLNDTYDMFVVVTTFNDDHVTCDLLSCLLGFPFPDLYLQSVFFLFLATVNLF